MENEKMQFNFAPGSEKVELIIREVSSVNELTVKAPVKIALIGTIGAVVEFLEKRRDQNDQINQKHCHILVNRESINILLVTNESDEYARCSVSSTLSIHPKFKEFGINSGKVWTPTELGMFFKMNRAFFPQASDNMKLVTDLINFKGTVDQKIEKSVKEAGDRTDNFSQVVNSNLPKSFTLKIPIFRGMSSETLEVETFARIDGREVGFILLSPAANQTMEEVRDKIIDEQIEKIRSICPDIAIIEQ